MHALRRPADLLDISSYPTAEDASRVVVSGELDMFSAPVLSATLENEFAHGVTYIELDLTGVGFIDARSARLLHELDHVPPARRVVVADASAVVLQVLDLTSCG